MVRRFERRNQLNELKSILNSSLKTLSKNEAYERLNTEKYILVRTDDKQSLIESLILLSDSYSEVPFSKNVLLFQSSKEKDIYHINFVNEPDFKRFMYFVNFLIYPGVEGYMPLIQGYWTLAEEDGIKEHLGDRVMLFIPEEDDEYDNVYLSFTNKPFNAKFGFAVGDGYKELNTETRKFEETKPNAVDFELETIINHLE